MYPVKFELGFISQKTTFFIDTAGNSSNLTKNLPNLHFCLSGIIYLSRYIFTSAEEYIIYVCNFEVMMQAGNSQCPSQRRALDFF
jgi:hypothetical protein